MRKFTQKIGVRVTVYGFSLAFVLTPKSDLKFSRQSRRRIIPTITNSPLQMKYFDRYNKIRPNFWEKINQIKLQHIHCQARSSRRVHLTRPTKQPSNRWRWGFICLSICPSIHLSIYLSRTLFDTVLKFSPYLFLAKECASPLILTPPIYHDRILFSISHHIHFGKKSSY